MSIHALPTPCWELTHHDEISESGYPHYATEEAAAAALWRELRETREDLGPGETMREDYPGLLESTPAQNREPCVVLICDGCGLGMHWEGWDAREHGTHWYSPEEAQQWLDDGDTWTTTGIRRPDGQWLVFHHCWGCSIINEILAVDAGLRGGRP